MWTLIRNGGYVPMSFLFLFGMASLAAAFYFALRADRRLVGFIKGMMQATLFATLGASCADLGATLYGVEKTYASAESAAPGQSPWNEAGHILVEGFAESTSPGIVGFSFLALSAMLLAVGRRRLDERGD